jgi:hypothetical protein
MTDSLAWQSILHLAFAGSLVQISLWSFMFVWEKYRHGETTSSAGADVRMKQSATAPTSSVSTGALDAIADVAARAYLVPASAAEPDGSSSSLACRSRETR